MSATSYSDIENVIPSLDEKCFESTAEQSQRQKDYDGALSC